MAKLEVEDVRQELWKLADAKLDQAPERRKVREAFKDFQLGIDFCLFKASYTGLNIKESYEVNTRGLEIFTKSWIPETSPIKAIICFCHGYGDTCTFFIEGIARKLASSGFGVFAMDYPGFGLSEGLHGFIPSFDRLVDDVAEHYSNIKETFWFTEYDPGPHGNEILVKGSSGRVGGAKISGLSSNTMAILENREYKSLPSFLFGQSMGGAVALKIHLKQPHAWSGAILVAPMCKIADDMVPPWLVTQILIGLAKLFPSAKLVPQKDFAVMAFKDVNKREMTKYNVVAYKSKPRLRTAVELLRTTQEFENHLEQVSLPLLILHGEADIITDPSVSKTLYEKACSSDKKLHLYKDAWHSLLEGESDEMIFQVLNDIISWLDEHSIVSRTC